ncbi:hybrid sensor histidine kinase/response regulator [Parabacteroides sp. 52]|uniref:hybrid sensor histidine kinase/response regulator transcription factor n=1 Tax=unclassified Parabacteroides TaxID=2649774 RepID=UPI0013D017C8|nr:MULTISPECIES: hybrid sensor histidine kinase/response regulator transcription factor [unclassified Parabacteroides]MDH6534259.1 ligand-binding sensor domain-containing protein/signal transduction histidine kinase/DNA-binding response OmpR family regulator [Parabacteroides sp. PM5-20]NDV55357.1 hybrid sensor histidine kinase/response regulator [Parabacteroides sp. 52]
MKYLFFFAILLSITFHLQAENEENYYFRHYTNRQGLSHNTVYHSLQDSKGFLWFGTDDGLNRFDGYSFTVYRYNSWLSEEEGLPHDRIIRLSEDSTGKVWICTNGGTCYYDYTTNKFHPLPFITGENKREIFHAVEEDKDKNLWFSSSQQIIKYNPETEQIRIYTAKEYFYPRIMEITANKLPLFADGQDLYRYREDTAGFDRIPILTEKEKEGNTLISAICPVSNMGILVGTNNAGLKFFYHHSKKSECLIPDIYVRDITAYDNNTYWIASESGVYIYNLIEKSFVHLTKSLTNEHTIADNAIYSITKDREGGMWVGAFFGGISYLPQQYTPFHYYIGGKTHPTMLGNAVREICPDAYGHIWLGTEDNGINRYTPATGEIFNYSRTNPVNKLSATNIHGLFADENQLWVGTFNKGIDVLDIPSGKIIKRYTQENTNQGLISDFVLCFTKTSKGEFLVGTSLGVLIYNKEKDNFSPWNNIRSLIRQIYEDSQGRIWVVTGYGVYQYIPEGNSLIVYTSTESKQSIGSNNTTSVFEDSKGRIWVTTTYGLSLYNEQAESFSRITTEDGLPSNIVYRIVEDKDGLFWVTTANGLVRFNPDSHTMRTYTTTDGLPEPQFNFSSSYKAPDGMIYMGTINGMISFNPRQFKEDRFVPPVYITHLYVPEDKKEKYSATLSLNQQYPILELPYHSATFTLSYTAIEYASPEAIHYAYMLEGVDKGWIAMGTKREVTFANLPPGHYTFKVKSTNSSNAWQDNECHLHLVITPPFWATGWAYTLYILLLISFILLFYNYKKRQLERRHLRAKEIFENEKEKELYNAKIQFFTFITHEIRTPLTLIKAPLEKIIRSEEGSLSMKKNLQTIEKNTQRLLDLSNQLLDFRKTESRGFRLNYVKTDIKMWTDTIIQPFLPVFENEKRTFSAFYPEAPLFAYIDREAYAKIVSNLLTNALKYSEQMIAIELIPPREGEEPFLLQVTNDGPLVPENEEEAIFSPFYRLKETENIQGSGIGLSLSRSLAEFHEGTLVYRSTADGLNRFLLALPVKQENYYLTGESETTEEKRTEKTPPVQEHKTPVILVVEDQTDMRQFIASELSTTFQVLEAANGEKAIEILYNHTVNLIISDVMMPVMDGFELCNRVKNDVQYSHIPFIILTAQHNLQSRLKGLNKGADAYMEKPFSIELLLAQTTNLLKNREMLNKAYSDKPFTPPGSLAVSPVDDIFLNQLNTYLNENLDKETLSVENIATEMGMSTSSLYRKVKGLSGLSPNDFIRIARLKKAIQLMQKGEKRINEIAFAVGFSSPAYFSTCFQKQYGESPSEFLKKVREGTER